MKINKSSNSDNVQQEYETPLIVVVALGAEDVITGSNDGEWDDE